MNPMTKIARISGISAGIALELLSSTAVAQADVKVVSKVDIARSSSSISRTMTAYFKNERARLETGTAGKVAVYDYKAGRLYILDSATKTYYEKAIPKPGAKADLPARIARFVSIDITGDVQPVSGSATQNVAGISTKSYSLTSDVKIQPKQQGNVSGRRNGKNGTQGIGFHVEGDFQGADIAEVLPATSANRLFLFTQQILNSDMATGALASDLIKRNVIPLKGKVVITHSGNGRSPGRRGGANSTSASPASAAITVAMEVKKLEKNTILDSSLFTVPNGYQKVDAPQRGMGEIAELGGFGGE